MKKIVVLVGGSGSGKTTIANELEKVGYKRLVTTTTRRKRDGERNHVDYHFVSVDRFFELDRVEENEYAGNWYGLTKEEVNNKLEVYEQLVIVMDINGARAMQKFFPSLTKVVFIKMTESLLRERLKQRGTEEEIEQRVLEAKKGGEFTLPDNVDLIIENNTLGETLKTITHHFDQ